MERSALSQLERAPSKNINRGRLHALPRRHLTAVGSRRDLLFRPDAERICTSLAKPFCIGCKSLPSDEISAQSEPNVPTPPRSYPLDMRLVEAFRQPPEVTAIPAPKLESWPAKGYKAKEFDPTVNDKFFNRESESAYLEDLIRRRNPERVILLLGPESCGKSALIKELMKKDQQRFVHLNCGMETVTTSAKMAQALRQRASNLPAALGIVLRSTPAVSTFSWISRVFASFRGVTQADKDALAAPNEVNALKNWLETAEEKINLDGLLNFLKRICKEEMKAHVILATSDSFMVTWLEKRGFSSASRMDVVLGDLTHEEALRFVVGGKDSSGNEWPGLIRAYENLPALHKEDWEKVWAMCGGNIKLLRTCVADADVSADWGEAVESVGPVSETNVDSAWSYAETFPREPGLEASLWTSEDYQIAVSLIADASPYYAVSKAVLAAELQKKERLLTRGVTGIQVLNYMIEYNVLYVRPYSVMAKDIPRGVFFRMVERKKGLKEAKDSVVMMPSPAHLFAALNKID